MADKKISELPVAVSIDAADISVLVGSDMDYQFSFTTLLSFLATNLVVGSNVSFGATVPQNTTGNNGDVFIKTGSSYIYQKINGTWALAYTIPTGSGPDGTVLYGEGVPGSGTGANNDSYIDTTTGIFYLKTSGSWSQVFSMATGPQGPQGIAGTNGTNGANGNTILNGSNDPTNDLGNNGDFYLNTGTFYLFGPKAAGVWPAGVSIIGGAPQPSYFDYAKGSPNPVYMPWSDYADTYGNFPTILVQTYDTSAISTLNTLTGGSGYADGTYYLVPLTGGTGEGALAKISVFGGMVTAVDIMFAGTGYAFNDLLSADNAKLGGTGAGFSIKANALGNSYSDTQLQAVWIMNSANTQLISFAISDPDPDNTSILADNLRIIIK